MAKKDKQTRVYTLSDPFTNKVRFVGASKRPANVLGQLDPRFAKLKSPINDWLRELEEKGVRPIVGIVRWCKPETWQEELIAVTKRFQESGADLIHNPYSEPGYKRDRPSMKSKLEALERELAAWKSGAVRYQETT